MRRNKLINHKSIKKIEDDINCNRDNNQIKEYSAKYKRNKTKSKSKQKNDITNCENPNNKIYLSMKTKRKINKDIDKVIRGKKQSNNKNKRQITQSYSHTKRKNYMNININQTSLNINNIE